MTAKKIKNLLATVIIILLVIFFIYFAYHYITTIKMPDQDSMVSFISKNTGDDKIKIKKTAYENGYLASYYTSDKKEKIIILKRDTVFHNRFRYFGSGTDSARFGTYNYSEANKKSLIIVYGDNESLDADSYEFKNDGKTYKKDNLGQYVLDIYCFQSGDCMVSDSIVYDEDGNKICAFNDENFNS